MSENLQAEALEQMTTAELRELAAYKGLSGISQLSKQELIDRLLAEDQVSGKGAMTSPDAGQEPSSGTGSYLPRAAGISLQVISGIGILLNLILIVLVFIFARQQIPTLESGMKETAGHLNTVAISIQSASRALESTGESLISTATLVEAAGDTLGNLAPFLDTVARTLGTEVPEVIRSSQRSLQSAQSGAKTIDSAMRLISLIPLIGVDYAPESTLHSSLGEVVDDLDPLPESMLKLQGNLDTLSTDVRGMQVETSSVATNIIVLSQDLEVLKENLDTQSELLSSLASDLSEASESVGSSLMVITGVLMLVLFWVALGQIAAFYVGGQIGK